MYMSGMHSLPYDYEVSGFGLFQVPWEYLHLNGGKITTPQQSMPFDDEGIGIKGQDGRYFDHPVRQPGFVLTRIDQFKRTGDEAYLDLCLRHVNRFLTSYVERDNAWYFPYHFAWNLHRFSEAPMDIPWYSGMAQGYVLAFFSRMYTVTGDEAYLDLPHNVFRSFLQPRESSRPWIVDLEQGKYLWFEEYARDNGPSDRAFNGHIYAAYGLYDYWLVTQDERAKMLIDGALTSVLGLLDQWRYPGGRSFYCLTHREQTASYHGTHCAQLSYLFNITRDPIWTRLHDLFLDDYPAQVFSETGMDHVHLEPGEYHAYRGEGLEPQEVVEVSIFEPTRAKFDIRDKINNDTRVSFRLADESYKFLWFPELEDTVYIEGYPEHFRWPYPMTVDCTSPRLRLDTFDMKGVRTNSLSLEDTLGLTLQVSERAMLNGAHRYKISMGDYANYWIRAEDVSARFSVA
jgi:hypothetical protein